MQRTVKKSVSFQGITLHSGQPTRVTLNPAGPNSGVRFRRTDLPGLPIIPAHASQVFDTSLATRVGTSSIYVSTIEHLMAAFYAFGITNILVDIDGPEMPIADGSALPFLVLLDEAGIEELEKPSQVMRIKKAIEITDPKDNSRFIRIEPSKIPFISYCIDFSEKTIGRQSLTIELTGNSMMNQILFARTFCRSHEIEWMRSRGLARGGSLDNALVVGSEEEGLLNRNGLRSKDEFVRHKILDCIGDMALLGMPFIGHILAHKAGHDLHTALAKEVWAVGKSKWIETVSPVDLPNHKSDPLSLKDASPILNLGLVFG